MQLREENYPSNSKSLPMSGSHRVCLKIAIMELGLWNLITMEMGFILGVFLGKGKHKRFKIKKNI